MPLDRPKMRAAIPGLLLALVAISGVWLFTKCADGACEPVVGSEFDTETFTHVEPGTTAAELRAKVGVPMVVTRQASSEQWRYFCRCKRESWLELGPIHLRTGGATLHEEAIVELRSGRVTRLVKVQPWTFE